MESLTHHNEENSSEPLDLLIEDMLHNGTFVGEGRDGIVMRVKLDNKEEEILGLNTPSESGYALKILKIFKMGEGKKEYDIQMKAYELLSSDPDKYAQVPRPILVKKQHLTPSDREYLNKYKALMDEDAEIILMDYIDGNDFAIHVYNYILSKHGFDEQVIENMSIDDKFSHIAKILNFEFTSDEGGFEEAISLRDNARKLTYHLKKINFKVESNFLSKLKASITELEKNKIFHNDLRERNVIMGHDGNPYIIDFGRSVDNFEDHTFDDMALVRRFKDINEGEETKIQNETLEEVNRWKRNLSSEQTKKWNLYMEEGKISIIQNYLLASINEEKELDKNLSILFNLLNQAEATEQKQKIRSNIAEVIKFLQQSKITPFVMNKLNRFNIFLANL